MWRPLSYPRGGWPGVCGWTTGCCGAGEKKGTQPDPGHLVVALFTLAIEMGLLHILPAVRELKDERSFLFAIVAMFKVRIFNGTH